MYSLLLAAALVAAGANAIPSNLIASQGVTAQISPSALAPSGCVSNYSGSFGIAVMNTTLSFSNNAIATGSPTSTEGPASTAAITQSSDGQPEASSLASVVPVTQLTDGQPGASTVQSSSPISTEAPVSIISNGQPQTPTTMVMTMGMISQIDDGQIQAPVTMVGMTVTPVSQISDGQIQATPQSITPVSTINDGQPQAPTSQATVAPVSTISDGQPQAPTLQSTVAPVSTIDDGQPQAPTSTSSASTASTISQTADGQIQATPTTNEMAMARQESSVTSTASVSAAMMGLVACAGNSTLSITLENGDLIDNQGRTGYIASNYQFQFDKPAQAGAIYTAGWSVCSNGSLALGGSTIFYQCLSGGFYNLYNENWAPQCNPVTISTLMLQSC